MKNLCFGVLLAPYRLDYYNYIHKKMNCDIYFQLKGFKGQLYSTEYIEKKCVFTPKYLRIRRIFGDRQIVFGLKQIIKDSKPSFIIVPEFSFLTIQIILIKIIFGYKFKIISQCDDSYRMLVDKGFSKVHAIARKLCIKFIDNLILADTKAKEWYNKKYNKGIWMPIIIDDNKFNTKKYNNIQNISKKYKDTYQLQKVKTLLFVGRLIEVKNIHRLIEACSKLQFDYKLFIIGEGELKNKLQEFASKKEINITFLGQLNGDSLYAWYYTADVFILPSTMEAFGAVTNEALLLGCNCCVSEMAGSSCLIKNGENGFLINPMDIDDIKNKIEKAVYLPQTQNRSSKMKFSFTDLMNNLKNEILND